MRRRYIVALALLLILAGAGAIVFYYHYQSVHYVTTDDARVAADMVNVVPEVTGKLVEWQVKEGDKVEAGEVLGRQDLSTVLSSGAVNPQSLGPVAGVMAEKALIKAPIRGEVIQSRAVVGQMASPTTLLAVIADLENAYVSANIKEKAIEKVKVGQFVEVKIDAYPGRTFSGRVESIGRATTSAFSLLPTQNTGGNYTKVTQVVPVKIRLVANPGLQLLPGMNVTVKIHVK